MKLGENHQETVHNHCVPNFKTFYRSVLWAAIDTLAMAEGVKEGEEKRETQWVPTQLCCLTPKYI